MSNNVNQVYSSPMEEFFSKIGKRAQKSEEDTNNDFSKLTITSSESNNIDYEAVQKILDSVSFELNKNKTYNPSDISFSDYQKLTYDALKVIFDGDSEKIGEASGLMNKAQLTDDDVLNKIYFDEELNALNNDTENKYTHTLGMIAIMNGEFMIDENGVVNTKNLDGTYSTERKELYTTKEKLFADFDKFKQYYQNTKERWTDNINMEEVFSNMDEIKNLYNQKIEENNAILTSLTKNTKQQVV